MRLAYGISAAAALAVGVGAAVAQEGKATAFDFFANPDQEEVGYTDFNAALDEEAMFDEWDEDADETLSRDEVSRGIWSRYDANDDDILDADELERARDEDFFGMGG